jgi:hypothetical protein
VLVIVEFSVHDGVDLIAAIMERLVTLGGEIDNRESNMPET